MNIAEIVWARDRDLLKNGDFLQNYQNTTRPSNFPPVHILEMIFENQFGIVKLIHTVVKLYQPSSQNSFHLPKLNLCTHEIRTSIEVKRIKPSC